MMEIINNIGIWINEQWDAFIGFIHNHSSNPFLWLGLFLGGLAIAMWAFGTLNKDAR